MILMVCDWMCGGKEERMVTGDSGVTPSSEARPGRAGCAECGLSSSWLRSECGQWMSTFRTGFRLLCHLWDQTSHSDKEIVRPLRLGVKSLFEVKLWNKEFKLTSFNYLCHGISCLKLVGTDCANWVNSAKISAYQNLPTDVILSNFP